MSESPAPTRTQAKANRRTVLLDSAAALFAQRGFNGVSLEDLGAAAGVSGPAVYRHFSGKQALLGALLVGVSEDLLAGGRAVLAEGLDDGGALRELVAFHVDFALTKPDVIRVQDRDFDSLSEGDQRQVRSLQRGYVELWVDVLGRLYPDRDTPLRRLQAHAVFGLINSTPHSVQVHGRRAGAAFARPVLQQLALNALAGSAH
ncbi:AcrR family transcriptional regulator [Arthrobacter silviterrae]|uniref:TetR/AcrR family transcriptional regulator n=1 Tax=Arthrobacter silviterrae TaxID=2026658 RepID=A0ABX0DC45_9MICC|nr:MULTISPECIES: TetR/AcrR family transcriptional regulator [Arthrobacter]MCU6480312.1 TetR/AcrR family transcriptional regulator [Arthrobacter sp. A2-55]MDQ0279558.1 AcrR family transcriptional regulator [Arthrobacter silviterrae]NGN81965.1 TetR/AcrR family transcriptional regulator [Arthrobacter silviterrae]